MLYQYYPANIYLFKVNSRPFLRAPIVDFEQVNVSWKDLLKKFANSLENTCSLKLVKKRNA